MRAAILTAVCVAGLGLSANQASAGDISIGFDFYRPAPAPIVVVRPVPTYYPPIYQPYYPPIVRPAPIYVAPRPVYYPPWGPPHRHHHHHHNHWRR